MADEKEPHNLSNNSVPEQETTLLEPIVEPKTAEQPSVKRRRRRWPWVTLGAVVLLGGGYVGAAFALQDTLPATLTVEGVDVSGLELGNAQAALEEEFAVRAQREITVTVPDVEEPTTTLIPAEAGYEYDVEATLEPFTQLSFNPVQLWSRMFGEAHIAAEKTGDAETTAETLAGLSEQLTFEPTEGSVSYEDAEVQHSKPVNGYTVDDEQLEQVVADQWLSDETQLQAPGEVEDPLVSAGQWETFIADTAQPLVDGQYTVNAEDASTTLSAAQLASAAQVTVDEGEVEAEAESAEPTEETAEQTSATDQTEEPSASPEQQGPHPVLTLDGEVLTDALAQNSSDFVSTHQDATVRLTGNAGSARPEVVPGSVGFGVDGDQVSEEILADLTGEITRTIAVDLHEVQPEITTEQATQWDVNHAVAQYSTPYPPHDGPRTENLRVGAQRVNGTVVLPGEQFNLNSLLAPVTLANGYKSSGVVESGVVSDAVGGGLSQIATMSYNAGFLGGMEIVEHKPHSRWFDRYPRGRESTYWEGQINVRWQNDTDAPVIVEMWLANSKVHTRLWGADYYDISTTTSDAYNFTVAPTIRSGANNCTPERGGRQGFTVDVHRTKTPHGGNPIQESWSWAYSGWPTVVCQN